MKKINIIIFLSSLFFGCNSNNESSNHCSCPISENVDIKTEKEKQNSEKGGGFGAKTDIEAVIKKAVDAKISISGSYSNSESKIEEVYKEIKGANPQITQNANFYRSIACAYYNIACQDKSLNEKEKIERLNEVVAGYEQNIHKIIDEEKKSKIERKPAQAREANTVNRPVIPNNNTESLSSNTDNRTHLEEPPVVKKTKSIKIYKKDDVLFEVLECNQVGINIECKIKVFSPNKDIDFWINCTQSDGRLISSSGAEYELVEAKLGDKTSIENVGAVKTIVAGVPIICNFIFAKATESIELASKIDFRCNIQGLGYFTPEFRNIQVN